LSEHGEKDNGNCQVHSVSVQKGVVNQKEHLGRSFATADTAKYNLAYPHDVIYTKSPTGDFPFGIVKQNKKDFDVIVSPLYGVFRPTNRHIGTLVESYFESPSRAKQFLEPVVQKGAKNTIQISNETFLSRVIPFPIEPQEQQKVADCLSSVDELIAAGNSKLDALRIYKKGLVQQLFPSEAENIPRLRFPEFRKDGAWPKPAAGKLFSNRIERGRLELPVYSVTMNDGLVPRSSLDRKIEDIADSGANKAVHRGDIAYNMMRMWQGALGVASEDCMVSPAYIVLKSQDVNPYFFYFLLKLPQMLRVLTAHSRGLTEDRLRLYFDDFSKIRLFCPSLPEQNRIADCLLSLDRLITAQGQDIERLKAHKNGLLQQLLPVQNEVQA
jgi:type I restriction enzyme S subunit